MPCARARVRQRRQPDPDGLQPSGREFVGVDFSQQPGRGRAAPRSRRWACATSRIEHASILDVDRTWGEFDYIICHGVFSWVEPPCRTRFCGLPRATRADGVAYVSYNTYPGWHMREMVRHMMRYHARHFDEPTEQIEQARALLDFLASASRSAGPYGQLLTGSRTTAAARPTRTCFTSISSRRTRRLFPPVRRARGAAGLQYLSEAVVSEMLTHVFRRRSLRRWSESARTSCTSSSTWTSCATGSSGRRCSATTAPPDAGAEPGVLHGLLISSAAVTEPRNRLFGGYAGRVTNGKQRADVTRPATKAAFAS